MTAVTVSAERILGYPPFTEPDGTPVPDLENRFHGQAAILIGGGPSFASVDHAVIRRTGLMTMTLKDSVKTYRSDLWLGVESPAKFDRSIWTDPLITKFVRARHAAHHRVRTGSNVVIYHPSEDWYRERIFAPDNTITWYNELGGGARTSMMEALRVLFLLGIRTLHLFGVDFHQSRAYGYHHPAPGYRHRVEGNNRLYRHLSERLEQLRPLLEQAGLTVYNCNQASLLDVFEKRGLDHRQEDEDRT